MKRSIWFIVLVGWAVVVAAATVWAQVEPAHGFTCDIAGAWVGSTPPIPYVYSIGQVITATITPTDSTGKRLADRSQSVNLDPTTGGMFPDANRASESMATYVRIGPRTYQFTMITYLMKSPPPGVFERDQILYFFTMNGKAECLDANTMKLTGTVSNWSNVDGRISSFRRSGSTACTIRTRTTTACRMREKSLSSLILLRRPSNGFLR